MSRTRSLDTGWCVWRGAGPRIRRPNSGTNHPPHPLQNYYIAKIEILWSKKNDDCMEVTWFYAPEDTEGGRKQRDGKRFEPAPAVAAHLHPRPAWDSELFHSNLSDTNAVETVVGHAMVVDKEYFDQWKAAQRKESGGGAAKKAGAGVLLPNGAPARPAAHRSLRGPPQHQTPANPRAGAWTGPSPPTTPACRSSTTSATTTSSAGSAAPPLVSGGKPRGVRPPSLTPPTLPSRRTPQGA